MLKAQRYICLIYKIVIVYRIHHSCDFKSATRIFPDPTDKDTKHIKDRSTGTEGYLEYTKHAKGKEKGKVNQLDVGNKKDQQNSGSNNPRSSKNSKNKTKWPTFGASDKNHGALRTTKQQ